MDATSGGLRVVVVTTSYPRHQGDYAGRFVADAVEHLRARGVTAKVVAPGSFRHFGLAAEGGIVRNLKRRPWALPLMLGSVVATVRRAAEHADLVHAHWLPLAVCALRLRRPVVVTLHGSDLEYARRFPALARRVLRLGAVVIAVSRALAEDAARLGARDVRVVPNGIDLPRNVGPEAEPPQVLFVGRLTPEKGVAELVEATRGLDLVVAGDGPLRSHVPGALGFVPRAELEGLYARAAVAVFPSRREGFGVACAEAMAHGRPVVASAVGGLRDLVVDGETGFLVPPRDPAALRAAIERLLADPELRRRLGAAARRRVAELCDWERVTTETLAAYQAALA
jgi:colanic acid/amylovoran biosynthesis glycosyltransferase